MTPGSDVAQSQQEAVTVREPLVDIDTKPSPPEELEAQVKPRRKRLSDMQGPTENPQPESKTQRRCLSDMPQVEVETPTPERQTFGMRPRLASTSAQTALMEVSDETDVSLDSDAPSACAQDREVVIVQAPVDLPSDELQIAEMQSRQSLPVGAAGGLLATVVGAMLWAVVTTATSFHAAWMAIPLGLMVGGVVRVLGRGVDRSFAWAGTALTVFGCLLGMHLTNCMLIAHEAGLSTTAVLARGNPLAIIQLTISTFHPLDILFYSVAIYEGYRLSRHHVGKPQAGAAPRDR